MKSLLYSTLAAATLGMGGNALAAEKRTELQPAPYVAPRVFKVKTTEVDRFRELRSQSNAEGDSGSYTITVVIYQELFSDGTIRTRKRSFRSGSVDNKS